MQSLALTDDFSIILYCGIEVKDVKKRKYSGNTNYDKKGV